MHPKLVHLLVTFLVTGTTYGMPSNLTAWRDGCGHVDGMCDILLCAGLNDPNGGKGYCQADLWWGCPCTSVCDGIGDCDMNMCAGKPSKESPKGGQCSSGIYAGCWCDWDWQPIGCAPAGLSGSCDENECFGVPDKISSTGWRCSVGKYKNCHCVKYQEKHTNQLPHDSWHLA
ncbi:hypothetical protein F5Y16DRAFT_229016 [Xylariaceae sp. FL0255]|nr:hypothetical protein F5Y16DRAFT_229016 [Xylariaceae sp. FL0255]